MARAGGVGYGPPMLATMMLRRQRWPHGRPTLKTSSMGITSVTAAVQALGGRKPRQRLVFLVDSGAVYSVLPARTWKALGLTATRHGDFSLADGTTIRRGIAEARFTLAGVSATSPVICGEERDSALLGAVTLETLGLMLNPLTRELLPMRLLA